MLRFLIVSVYMSLQHQQQQHFLIFSYQLNLF